MACTKGGEGVIKKNQRGFTLNEATYILVVSIIGIVLFRLIAQAGR